MKRMIITLNGNEYLATSRRAYAKAYAEAMLFPVDHKEKAKPAPVMAFESVLNKGGKK